MIILFSLAGTNSYLYLLFSFIRFDDSWSRDDAKNKPTIETITFSENSQNKKTNSFVRFFGFTV
ncbi:hypothetical protein KSI01_25030 [Kurthia sibirica]|nr:hypothetical protein KSI01_25030 [Kurthia sibirica]